MRAWQSVGVSLATLVGMAAAVSAQYAPQLPRARQVTPNADLTSSGNSSVPAALAGSAVSQDSSGAVVMPALPALTSCPCSCPCPTAAQPEAANPSECDDCSDDGKWGPTLPEDVKLIMSDTPVGQWLDCHGMRLYGWADVGYTYSSAGSGLMTVETRENRFGNEFLVNQLAVVLERPIKQEDDFNFGFKILYYGGADAALLQPLNGIDSPPRDPRFSHDFRELYLNAHFPVLTEEGVDLRVGRMSSIIGYESAMAPYRPFYSNDYQWFYSQDGAWTGALATFHFSKQFDVLAGVTMGANTFFKLRDEYCYVGQVNWWPDCDKKTLLSASVHTGRQAIFTAPARLLESGIGQPVVAQVFTPGDNITMVELRVQHEFNKYFTAIIQSDDGWETNMPGVGTGEWYSLYGIFIYHAFEKLDVNLRAEWFNDVQGTRTGFNRHYYEATVGLDFHPTKFLRIRPEVRGDFANDPVFNNGRDSTQLTVAIEALLSF